MKQIISLLAIILLSSCSAKWHMNKALLKDPKIMIPDTVVTYDTVWRAVPKVDTVFEYFNTRDTVTIFFEKDSVIVRYLHTDSTVYIEADCPDCPEIHKDTQTTKTVLEPQKWHEKARDLWWLFLIIFGLNLYVLVRRR